MAAAALCTVTVRGFMRFGARWIARDLLAADLQQLRKRLGSWVAVSEYLGLSHDAARWNARRLGLDTARERRGLTDEQLREALGRAGSIAGAARLLGRTASGAFGERVRKLRSHA
jgi:hypothetical protein